MTNLLWILAVLCLAAGFLLILAKLLFRRRSRLRPAPVKSSRPPRFAVLIPARDESKVINKLLSSLVQQTQPVPMGDVYVIVEKKSDPTVRLAQHYGARVFVREDLAGKHRKGFALAEVIEYILAERRSYDAFFIFDADNTLERHYFERMAKTYRQGYAIGIARRRTKNPENATAVGSGLIFTIINELINRPKTRRGLNCLCSGTGFFLSGKLVKKLGTYPFHSLTEDYELSTFATLHSLPTAYNCSAIFYDHQPARFRDYFTQRVRWVAGYFEARANFAGQLSGKLSLRNPNFASVFETLVGVYDLILILIGLLLLALFVLASGDLVLLNLFGLLLAVYLALAVFTFLLLRLEKPYRDVLPASKPRHAQKSRVPFLSKRPALGSTGSAPEASRLHILSLELRTILWNPVLLLAYIPAALVVLFRRLSGKPTPWSPTPHA